MEIRFRSRPGVALEIKPSSLARRSPDRRRRRRRRRTARSERVCRRDVFTIGFIAVIIYTYVYVAETMSINYFVAPYCRRR